MTGPFPAWLAAAMVAAGVVWAIEQVDQGAAWGLALILLLSALVIGGGGAKVANTLSGLVSVGGKPTPSGGLGTQNTPQNVQGNPFGSWT